MNKIIIKTNNLNPHFIGSWILEPLSICEDLINYFERNIAKQTKGRTIGGVNINIKDSVDIRINPKEIILPGNEAFKIYFEKLFECYKNYINEWPFLKDLFQELEIGSFNIQKYSPGQHFKKIHTERSSIDSAHRVFAFMTYLNDVDKGGSTYFSHYDLEIQPRKGLTLIWPAEWTHAHRGNILKEGSKYIITGWLNFAI
tara:strand:- start:1 stop:600 length:600 start_codon:yes stop_codon:yes gene_type:complete